MEEILHSVIIAADLQPNSFARLKSGNQPPIKTTGKQAKNALRFNQCSNHIAIPSTQFFFIGLG
jgi:hypothetical protein